MAVAREGVEDEVVRQYHEALARANISQAIDELGSLAMEKNILQHMARLKRDSGLEDDVRQHNDICRRNLLYSLH